MSTGLKLYLEWNLLLAVGYGLCRLSGALLQAPGRVEARGLWRLALALFLAAPLLVWASQWLPGRAWVPPVKVWAPIALYGDGTAAVVSAARPLPRETDCTWSVGLSWLPISRGLATAFLALAAICLARLVARGARLRAQLRSLPCIHRRGAVRVLVSESESVAYAAWTPGIAAVVLPLAALGERGRLRWIVAHELQHLRQRDPLWLWLFELTRSLCAWNPAVHLWCTLMNDIGEFACDEALMTGRRLSPQTYGRCLLWAAENAVESRLRPTGTAGLVGGSPGSTLKRRIEMLFDYRKGRGRPKRLPVIAVVTLLVMGSVSLVARALVQTRELTLAEARALARPTVGGFPLVVNEEVLAQLNRWLGTPKGRDFLRASLARMPRYRADIDGQLKAYHLPVELLAVPLVESGYQNIHQDKERPERGAGIWMFTGPTAHNFGLSVEPGNDERLLPNVETDAAMRMLAGLNLRFRDWGLALAAYNQGEDAVQRAMNELHTRDIFRLMRAGRAHRYFADVVAVALILKNPSLLE